MGKNKKKNRGNQKRKPAEPEPQEVTTQTMETTEDPVSETYEESPEESYEKKAVQDDLEAARYLRDEPTQHVNTDEDVRKLEEDQERQEKMETKKLTKQFQNKAKEVDKIISDAKIPIDKKISMLYEKAVKGVKELGNYKKQQILMERKIEQMKIETQEKRVSLEKQDKQKQSLLNLYTGLKDKNLEAHREHDIAMENEKEEKKKMSTNFQKRITDISAKLQQQYDDKEKVKTKNQELRNELSKLLEQYKKMEKKYSTEMATKTEEMNQLQDSIKNKIDSKLSRLMENFNTEKEKYEKLSKQELEINNSFSDLKKKYDNFKDQIDKRREKEEKYSSETTALENRIKQLSTEETVWAEKKVSSRQMLDQAVHDNSNLAKQLEALESLKKDLQDKVSKK